jgi:hypothetical protein
MMQTSLRGIANKAAQNQSHRFQNLISLLTAGFLLYCWQFVNKRAAAGVDRTSAFEYAQNLASNVEHAIDTKDNFEFERQIEFSRSNSLLDMRRKE